MENLDCIQSDGKLHCGEYEQPLGRGSLIDLSEGDLMACQALQAEESSLKKFPADRLGWRAHLYWPKADFTILGYRQHPCKNLL